MNIDANHVKWFRDSAPYINAHRQKTFVIYLGGDALAHENFVNIVNDITLLNSLGVKLIIVHGAKPQIDDLLEKKKIKCRFHENLRITTPGVLSCVEDAVGRLRLAIEARLSMGLINSPMHGAEISVSSGNFVKAKPFGIRDGTDFEHTGEVRRIHAASIESQLQAGSIVLISPIGYSNTVSCSTCLLLTWPIKWRSKLELTS